MQLLAAHRSGGSRRWTWCTCPRYSSRARCPTSTAAVRLCIIPGDAGCCVRRAVQWPRVLGRRITLLWKRCLAKVVEVLEDPSNRGQVLKMTEATARAAHAGFVVAPLGASRMSLAASLLRVCSSGPQEVRDGEFDARGAHIGRQTLSRLTDKSRLHCAIGTCSDVRCNREAPLASTKLGLSEWRLPLTAGLVSHLLWDVSDNSVRATLRGPGTCWLRTVFHLEAGGPRISSCSRHLLRLVRGMWGFRSLGTNSLVVIWSLGWASSKHTDHICWESRQGGRNGLYDGPQEVAGQNTV